MMCVSAGKSVGEIAWRRCRGIGSRGTRCRMAGKEKFGYYASVMRQKEKMGV